VCKATCVAAIGLRLKASLRSLNLSLAASEPPTSERENDRSALARPPDDRRQTPDRSETLRESSVSFLRFPDPSQLPCLPYSVIVTLPESTSPLTIQGPLRAPTFLPLVPNIHPQPSQP